MYRKHYGQEQILYNAYICILLYIYIHCKVVYDMYIIPFLPGNRTWPTMNNVSTQLTPAAFSSVVKCLRMSTRCSLKSEVLKSL